MGTGHRLVHDKRVLLHSFVMEEFLLQLASFFWWLSTVSVPLSRPNREAQQPDNQLHISTLDAILLIENINLSSI